MSCVAEANAATSASTPKVIKPPLGCTIAMPASPAATTICDSTIQPRRWPSRPKNRTLVLSMIGAHRNFSVYAKPTHDRKPIADSSLPFSRIQYPIVLPTR